MTEKIMASNRPLQGEPIRQSAPERGHHEAASGSSALSEDRSINNAVPGRLSWHHAPSMQTPVAERKLDPNLLAMAAVLVTGVALASSSLLVSEGWLLALIMLPALAMSGALLMLAHRRTMRREKTLRLDLQDKVERLADQAWELRESEERYRSIAEAFGDIVIHHDTKNRVLFANENYASSFGLNPADVTGSRFKPEVIETIHLDTRPGEPAVREVEIETVSGPRWFQWIELGIRDDKSGVSATRIVARDITAHKQAEHALESARRKADLANRAKSRFLATVSHEMRTPLNGILGMSALLRETALTPEQKTYNEAVSTSGSALLALIEDMLDLTLIEAGRLEPRISDFQPRLLVEEVCELLAARAHEKNIELAYRVTPQVPLEIRADAGRIRQILLNIVGNGIKFTERGGVTVTLDCKSAGNVTSLHFTVRDTGPGMIEKDKKRIFQEFEQADSATTRLHGGAGLGLSISKRIIEHMGGAISVESNPGEGTVFRFFFDASITKPAMDAPQALSGHSILIVSRSTVEAPLMAETIKAAGGFAEHVTTLGAAHKRLKQDHARRASFDAIVFDPRMSRDPVRSLERLRQQSDSHVFAFVLLEPGMRAKLKHYLDGGFDGYLVRPIRAASMERVLGEHHDELPRETEKFRPAGQLQQLGEDLPKLRILLAEDNEINALLVRSVLEKAGQCVTRVQDGREAVRVFRQAGGSQGAFDLVLMDLHMPKMDGIDAIRAIRRIEKKADLPKSRILMLSADEQAGARSDCTEAGSDSFLTKPIDPHGLLEELQRAVSINRT